MSSPNTTVIHTVDHQRICCLTQHSSSATTTAVAAVASYLVLLVSTHESCICRCLQILIVALWRFRTVLDNVAFLATPETLDSVQLFEPLLAMDLSKTSLSDSTCSLVWHVLVLFQVTIVLQQVVQHRVDCLGVFVCACYVGVV